jgi:hypothetical protein
MREFYEGKLKEMEDLLHEKEMESEKLGEELKKLDENHTGSKELAEEFRKKQKYIAELKKKKLELSRLTSVASRNESQIAQMRNDVIDMKQKKVTLQKQVAEERKLHTMEVQKLKKESMQKDREVNKLKKLSDRNAFEAHKAQHMAKTRLEQMSQLKTKYKETEKQLRVQTVRRGVMQKAGLDPVMVGRRETKKGAKTSNASSSHASQDIDFDILRDFFDQKVADVGRREALAEKLAHEWEEHLELSTKREELSQVTEEESSEALEAMNSQIKSNEERIRQLASRLGKRLSDDDSVSSQKETFLFDKEFQQIAGGKFIHRCIHTLTTSAIAHCWYYATLQKRRR